MSTDYQPPGDDDAPPDYPKPRLVRDDPPRGTGITMIDGIVERALTATIINFGNDPYNEAVAAGVTNTTFADTNHTIPLGNLWLIFDAITADGHNIDPPTIVSYAQARQWNVGSPANLYEFGANEGFKRANATQYAQHLRALEVTRHFYQRALSLSNGKFVDLRDQLDDIAKEWDAHHATSEGFFEDMNAVDETDPIIPSIMPRDDQATCLFYAPGINWMSGEPGEGKTIIALWAVARELRNGNNALYLDYEGTREAVRSRLHEMGVDELGNLHYKRVSDKWDAASLATLRQHINENRYTVAVIDAVAGAMEAEGLDPDNNRDVEKWGALIPQLLFNTGCAVICIDHVTKNAETRGRWMIGAQRKMARADLAYTLEMFEKAGVGKTGRGKLLVTKDRYGALGEHQSGKIIAQVSIVSTVDQDTRELFIRLDTPAGPLGIGANKPTGPTWYMEQVSRALEDAGKNGVYLGARELRTSVGKSAKWVDKAVVALLASGHIERVLHKGPGKPYRSVVPYRQPVEMIEHHNAEHDAPPPDDDDDWGDQPY